LPHVSIQHIIGTVALIGLAVSIALAYQIIVSSVEESVIKTQLNQTAEYISMSLTNVISLTDFTYGIISTSEPVTKHLDLPEMIGGKPYNITIVKREEEYYVHVEIIGRSDLYAESPIIVKSTQRIRILAGVDLEIAESLLEDFDVEPRAWVIGSTLEVVVWCYKYYEDDVMYAGLGILGGGPQT